MRNMLTRVGLILVLAAVAFGGTGCTPEQIAANEAKAKAILSAINNGARVTAAALKEGVDAVCANQMAVYSAASVARTTFSQQAGPNSSQNLANLDTALAAYNNACAAAASGSTPSASLLKVAIASYNAVKIASAK